MAGRVSFQRVARQSERLSRTEPRRYRENGFCRVGQPKGMLLLMAASGIAPWVDYCELDSCTRVLRVWEKEMERSRGASGWVLRRGG